MGSRWTNEKDEKLRIALYGTEINMIEDVGPSSLRERGRNKGKLNSSLLVFFFSMRPALSHVHVASKSSESIMLSYKLV